MARADDIHTTPTIYDVAKEARVSRQTVSNVLNSPAIVREDTRERVLTAIHHLGYRPHASARRLRTRTSSTLAIRIAPAQDGISGSVLDQLLHAVTVHARDRGLRVLLFSAADPSDEISQFEELLAGSDVDAFILTGTQHDDPRVEWLHRSKVPFVSFGRPWGAPKDLAAAANWVDVDGYAGLRQATLSLLNRGYAAVGFLGWPSPSGTGDERRRGWRDTMIARSGLPVEEIDALQTATTEGLPGARQATLELADRAPRLDALACASDTLALGAIMSGVGVPVTGFDDTPVAASMGFSSVRQPIDDVARSIIEILSELVQPHDRDHDTSAVQDDSRALRQRLLTPCLIERS